MSVIMYVASNLVETLPTCLFGFSRSTFCGANLNSFSETSYFSLGEAVGAFGLIFAVRQLAQPAWEITLDIRCFLSRYAHIFCAGFGLLAVFVAFLIPQIPMDLFPWV